GRAIPEDTGAVDFELETGRGVGVGGDDAVGVVGAVVVDVGDGGVEIVDDFDGEDVVEIFGGPVLFGGGGHVSDAGNGAEGVVAAQFHVLGDEGGGDFRGEVG